jgi:2-oxoglutarate ferredoxin oxidoreductase subunit delta
MNAMESKDGKDPKDPKVFWREPLDKDKIKLPQGRVFVIPERCKECDFCIEFCPRDVLEKSDEINMKGYHYPRIKEDKNGLCVNCRFCTLICPEFAIYTEEVGVEGEEDAS